MNSIRFEADQASPVVPLHNYTRLADIELYRQGTASTGMSEVGIDPVWGRLLDELCAQYPEALRRDLTLTVFALYAARVSEDFEAVFPLGRSGLTTGAYRFEPCSVALAPASKFADALSAIEEQAKGQTTDHGQIEVTSPADELSCIVTTGLLMDLRAAAHLHLHCQDDGAIRLWHASKFGAEAAALVAERMIALLRGIIDQPTVPLMHQPILSARERNLVLQEWNATDRQLDFEGGLVAMMDQAAVATPDHPALIYKDVVLSYADFNTRVNRLARLLCEKGVGTDQFVCLCMDRSLEMVIGIWATLKAGGAYVPLNVEDPASRINEIITDCRPKVFLTQQHVQARIMSEATEVIVLPEGGDVGPQIDDSDLGLPVAAHDLAYMIYTSGSTGKPKGVIVEHEAIHNRVVWMHEEYGLLPADRVLQKTPYTFDVSVWEFLWPLSVGSTLVIAEPGGHTAIGYLYSLIRGAGVTHLHFVPSVLRLFLMAPALDQLPIKKLFCSGEALGANLVTSFYEKASNIAQVHNLYGPTEAAVDVSYFACPRDTSDQGIPIGRPVSNTGLYILDAFDQPVPVGVPGELHIGGIQLARGYWARDELTAERFIACPIQDAPHRRLYRTGDLAFFRPDGQIIYMGRNDFQVKVNGVRIELGEVETAIHMQGGVQDAVVVAEEQAGSKALIAYVVADSPSIAEAERLQDGVAVTRPASYVPKEVRFIARMPLTTSGKINRKALADQPKLGEDG